jgi:quercetin dioxygenase-like cupin family protein
MKRRNIMLSVNTRELELREGWIDSDRDVARVNVAFPLNRFAGTDDSAVVYFEVEPGHRLATHTDSAEEILYIVTGSGEATIGDDRGTASAGDLIVIPAMAPHGIANTGSETLRVVGFFSQAEVTSTFEEPVQPVGVSSMVQGAPVPV